MTVTLYADQGELMVGARTACYVYGEFRVELPEGKDLAADDYDTGYSDGYVYRPPEHTDFDDFDIAFVRADADINVDAGYSNFEAIIDAAQTKVSEAVYFSSDIGPAGLGSHRPGIDFDTGDIVRVGILDGRYIHQPVTSITYGAPETRVHVGDQPIRDLGLVEEQNREVRESIAKASAQARAGLRQSLSTSSTAKQNSEIALRAATDADGVIQGHVETAWEHTVQAGKYSDAASEASDRATAASEEVAKQRPIIEKYAKDAQTYSMNASKHSLNARLYTDSAVAASEQSAAYS
ncbi:hypothetical protein ACEE90_01500, partial [Corynebacterium phoceense]